MINDVRSYFQTVIGRLSEAFRIDDFSVEKEAGFWNLAAEYLSQFQPSSYEAIVRWVDTLYEAPVHLVYRLQDGKKLKLLYRHLIPENQKPLKKISHIIDANNIKNVDEIEEGSFISLFDQQVNNIEPNIDYKSEFKDFGRITLSIGDCERLPLYQGNELWGIYCVGPFVTHPKSMDAKISIVVRSISKLLLRIEEINREERDQFEIEANEQIDSFGLGTLDIQKISRFFIRYICNYYSAHGGLVMEYVDDQIVTAASYQLTNEMIVNVREAFQLEKGNELVSIPEREKKLRDLLKSRNVTDYIITPFSVEHARGYIFLCFESERRKENDYIQHLMEDLALTFGNLLDFRERNNKVADHVITTFYDLLRGIEKSKGETYWHTPRFVAFADKFSDMLGLDNEDKKILLLGAKLHDIGYTGAIEINEQLNVGSEIEHPIIGELMIRMLPVNNEVKNGIRTHHEWVDGTGTPKGISGSEIPWTGKILSIIEFITEFVESNQYKAEEEWDDLETQLIQSIMDRTDKQFDIILVPIAINLIQALKWEGCLKLGVQ